MRIWTFQGGFDNNLSYLFFDGQSPEAAIVDASIPSEKLLSTIETNGLIPQYMLITHTHYDHIIYIKEFITEFPQLKICIFEKTSYPNGQNSVSEGDKLPLGSLIIRVIHTPGHYPDSVCFLVNGALFTGDTLFVGRTGRTISAGGNTRDLYRSIYQKILRLSENTVIYPGHHYGDVESITLSRNRKISPLLQASDEGDFVKRMKDYERSRVTR